MQYFNYICILAYILFYYIGTRDFENSQIALA